jgi:hypothetical protein
MVTSAAGSSSIIHESESSWSVSFDADAYECMRCMSFGRSGRCAMLPHACCVKQAPSHYELARAYAQFHVAYPLIAPPAAIYGGHICRGCI